MLLILAGITISLVFGPNGVVKKAQEAKEQTEIEQVREQLELAKGPEYIEGNGKYNPDSYFQRIEDEGIINDKEKDVIDKGDGTYEVTTSEGYIFIITLVPSKDNVEDIQIEYEGKTDGPRIRELTVTNRTTSSISVEVETANAEGATYTYYYKKDGETEWIKSGESKEGTYTFNGLEANVIYNIKVVVEKDGKTAEKETSTITGELPEGAVQFSPVEWENGQASTVITTSEEGYTLQYQIGGIEENNWTNTTSGTTIENLQHGTTVYGRLFDGTNGSKTASIDIKDEVSPTVTVTEETITTNSISVNVQATDNESEMKETSTYSYYIKKNGEAESSYTSPTGATGITQNTYTFTGLIQGTSYDIKVEVNGDKAGNIGEGTLLNKTTGTIGGATEGLITGSIVASKPIWSNGQASITLSTNTGLTIQYQENGINEGNWKNGTNVTGLNHNDTVYARLTDGTNYGNYASVDIKDNVKPNATIRLSGTSVETTGSVTATITFTDNESGLNITGSKWVYNTNAGAIGENAGSYANTFTNNNNPQTITLNTGTAGTYYLHVLTVDNAGNKKEIISNVITVEEALKADGSYDEEKGMNTPILGEGMTAIKWNGSSWVETTGSDSDWYDYSAKKWANAKTADGSMWVWIPRFAYSITSGYNTSTVGTIEVEFMKGLTNETATGRTTFQNASGAGNWNIHPAFNYGQAVSGIWAAKFEASQSDASTSSMGSSGIIKVQPGVQSWRDISVDAIYTKCLNYNSKLNSHMMKNDEWGAIAYLSKSKYGKQNEEVWINNSSSFITGSAGNSISATDAEGTNTNYTSTQGVKASTTGNVYGVYDMSGGAWEYVAAYVDNSYRPNYGLSLINGATKTKNVYNSATTDNSTNNYNLAIEVYGDAVYETSANGNSINGSWYSDYSSFPETNIPFFARGGDYRSKTGAGVFYFIGMYGYASSYNSFRPVLILL